MKRIRAALGACAVEMPGRENVEQRVQIRPNSRSIVVLRDENSVGSGPLIPVRSRALFLRRRLLVAVFLALATLAPAAAQEVELLEQAIDATAWQSASFRHSFRLHGSEQEIVESGKVTFGTLPQMRWQYMAPEKKVFVFDGKTSWLYVPAERQVSVHELTAGERDQLPFLLLQDAADVHRQFELTGSRKNGMHVLSLTPKSSSQIRSMQLSLDPTTKKIRAIEYSDLEGNITRFEFESFSSARKDPAQFRFVPPAGVESVEY